MSEISLLELSSLAIEEYENDPTFRAVVDTGVNGVEALLKLDNPSSQLTDNHREDLRMSGCLAVISTRLYLPKVPTPPDPFWLGFQGVPWK